MKPHSLVVLARELVSYRRAVKSESGAWVFCIPDVNFTPLRKECQILIAQIPDDLPDDERSEIEETLLSIYTER